MALALLPPMLQKIWKEFQFWSPAWLSLQQCAVTAVFTGTGKPDYYMYWRGGGLSLWPSMWL